MIPEEKKKGMLDFGRLYKYNLIWQFWGKITFPAYGSENNEISPGTSWWWCPEDVREHYGRLRRAFFLYERPRNQQRLQTSAFSHRRNQDGRAEKYNFKVEGNTFLDFCILKVQQVFNWGSLWLMVWQHAQLAKSCMPAAREGGFFQTHAAFTCSGWIYRGMWWRCSLIKLS